jgi:6-phosphogluconate dehydrogenase
MADIAVAGMAVMGRNLALNIESRGYTVAVHNRTARTLETFVDGVGAGKRLVPCRTLPDVVAALNRPRRILLMVQAGAPVDAVLGELQPLLEPGDVILDGGNSHFADTTRRCRDAEASDLLYLGTGVSGGDEGALLGPSIMPGGSETAYREVSPILTSIAAKVDGDPCCTYIGAGGAGHYVKMVHNGIEYGDMQLIGEAYAFMKLALGMSHAEMQATFAEWNRGELDSYLIEITADILAKTDPETGRPLVEVILDQAGQKGTGKWTSQSALDLGVPAPTIAEAVFARFVSALKRERVAAADHLQGPACSFSGDPKKFLEALRKALYASKICSYAQGFGLMRAAAQEHEWDLDYGAIAMIWRGGCIIRAKFLGKIKDAYDRDPALANLLLDPYFTAIVHDGQREWREVVATAATIGIPVPAFSSALSYYDSYRSATLSANMIQAQRDYFGAHTYQRIDRDGVFHTRWESGAQAGNAASEPVG